MPESTVAESVARWLASRTTRRSFLGKFGRGAVLVGGGSSLAALLTTQEAEARVCGQSGGSEKCESYDCFDVWGWCWYATGCCAGGALKKICDCCRAGFPNVHGYCPSGTNVVCIVESCGADPRVQVVATRVVPFDDPVAASAGASRARYGEGEVRAVWLCAVDALLAAVVAPWAARRGVPLYLTERNRVGGPLVAELQRLGATSATLVGDGLEQGVVSDLERYGLSVGRLAPNGDALSLSRRVTTELIEAGARRVFCVEPSGVSLAAAPLAGAVAAVKRYPVVVGVDAAAELASAGVGVELTYLVGPEAASRASEVDGGHPLHSGDLVSLSAELIEVAYRVEDSPAGPVGVMSDGGVNAAALLSAGGPIFVHRPGSLEGARDSLFAYRDRIRSVALVGRGGALPASGYYELQSIVNGFEAHKLIGVAGEGLPVIEQPLSERPVGFARLSNGPIPAPMVEPYWSGRVADLDE